MGFWTDLLTTLTKHFTPVLVAVAVFCTGLAILLLPDGSVLNLSPLRREYEAYVGVVTLFSGVIVVGAASAAIIQKLRANRAVLREGIERLTAEAVAVEQIRTRLTTLSPEEYTVMFWCLLERRQSVNAALTNQTLSTLVQKGLMSMGTSVNTLAYPFTIPYRVWEIMCEEGRDELDDPDMTKHTWRIQVRENIASVLGNRGW